MTPAWSFRPSVFSDATWMAELRAVVMRPDLERLGRYDPHRVRQRFLDAFTPAHTRVIQSGRADVGVGAVRPDDDGVWIEHFYLDPAQQGQASAAGRSLTYCAQTPQGSRSGSTSFRAVVPVACMNVTDSAW